MSPQAIQNAVANGWPIDFFEGSAADLKGLERFVGNRQDMARRMNPITKTELVFQGQRAAPVAAPAATEDKLSLIKKLIGLGASFQVASEVVESTADEIKNVSGYQDVAKLLGLDGRASGKSIHEAIRKDDAPEG